MTDLVRKLTVLVGLLVVVQVAELLRGRDAAVTPGVVTMIFGFAVLAGHFSGRLLAVLTLPRITGYLLAGVVLGPFAFGVVDLEIRDRLQMINQIALGLIALTAGGELRIAELRPRLRAIGWVTVLQTAVVFGVMVAALLLLDRSLELTLTAGATSAEVLAMALILGLIGVANSPASTVAVINEARARGPLTTLALGVTVVKDVVVVVLIAVTLALVGAMVDPESALGARVLLEVLAEIGLSLGLGVVTGAVIILYLRKVQHDVALFVLAAVLVAIDGSRRIEHLSGIHVHVLLIAMTAGFVVENFSAGGERLIRGIERSSLPIYVVFFTLSGVGLDLLSLRSLWALTLALAVLRTLLLMGTTWAGCWLAADPPQVRRWGFAPFVAQAGISLGLAELVAIRYPGWGDQVKTVVLAMIAIHQLIGPVLFKIALRVTGEEAAVQEPAARRQPESPSGARAT
ncbi:MAG TPA: cation:proton antiporter [Thermoanaerobaculia bacterium]|nr:cation:proton antiporter [Thermoanaerobaculia bacterium]